MVEERQNGSTYMCVWRYSGTCSVRKHGMNIFLSCRRKKNILLTCTSREVTFVPYELVLIKDKN